MLLNEPTGAGRAVFALTIQLQNKFNSIQFASWFIEYYSKQTYYVENHLDLDWVKDAPQEEIDYINRFAKTQMDVFSLLEVTMLHELTHTKIPGFAIDPPGWWGPEATDTGGWNIARANVSPNGWKSAENLAMAASAAYVISQGGKVNEDGSIVVP